jgi:8-oxo-dGTP pyrophosphatase MutT (NUDIX family)
MAISEHYAQIRRRLGTSLILVPGVAAIVRDETGRILFQRKHDGTWSLPAGAIEPGENPAQAIVREVQEETGLKVKPERIVGVFGGDGVRYQYPNGDQVEYTVILFECSNDGSPEQFDNEETQGLDYFAPEAPPPLGLAYPASIFSASSVSTYFEPAKDEASTSQSQPASERL